MTDAEINKKLAIFMGWDDEYEICFEAVVGGETIPEDQQKMLIRDGVKWRYWNPLNNISDAFEVVEKLKEKNILLNINTWTDAIEVMRVGSTKPNPYFYIFDIHPLSRAICEVAIKVIDDK